MNFIQEFFFNEYVHEIILAGGRLPGVNDLDYDIKI